MPNRLLAVRHFACLFKSGTDFRFCHSDDGSRAVKSISRLGVRVKDADPIKGCLEIEAEADVQVGPLGEIAPTE